MEDQGFDPKLLLEMISRQWRVITTVACLLLCVAALVAYAWPPTYRSTATILVEAQQIPQEYVRSTITTFADQRIQIISQTALARANLLDLIERYRLYPRLRSFETNDELVLRIRSAINVVPVTANSSGRGGEAVTIAFRVSFDYDEPQITQRVAGELTTLYLNANVKQRQESTAETSSFVADESARLRAQVEEIEARLEAFKVRNAGRLPEQVVSSVQLIEQGRADLDRLARELAALQDRRAFLESQLDVLRSLPAGSTPGAAATVPSPVSDPAERLRTLRVQLASNTAVYSPLHPDIVRLRREIESLEATVDAVPADGRSAAKSLADLNEKLAAAIARYSPDHPEVVQLRRRVEAMERVASQSAGGERGATATAVRDTRDARAGQDQRTAAPLLALEAQLDTVRSQVRLAEKEQADVRERMRERVERLAAAPGVEREYAVLTRDLASASAKHRELSAKLIEAEVAQQLEKERKAERFTLLEPALAPEAPIRPNRALILVLGSLLAIGAGLATGLLRDFLNPSIRSPRELERLTMVPLLAAIPFRPSREEIRGRVVRQRVWVGVACSATAAIALAIHLKVIPLNVALAIATRRLETLPAMLF